MGEVNVKVLSVLLKFLALLCCITAFWLNQHEMYFANTGSQDPFSSQEFMLVACTCYTIVLTLMIVFKLFKDEFEENLAFWFLFSGCVILLSAGCYYIATIEELKQSAMMKYFETVDTVAAVLAMVAGVVFFVDGLHAYGVF